MTTDTRTPEQVRIDLLTTVLTNIANGHWNAGRDNPITVEEYAREFLLRSHEPPRNSGEGTAVNGPMPLGEKDEAPGRR